MSSSIASRRRQLQVRVWEARSNFCKENNIPELGDWRGKCHRIGTDCSGLEAPIMSMQMMGLQYEHLLLDLTIPFFHICSPSFCQQ